MRLKNGVEPVRESTHGTATAEFSSMDFVFNCLSCHGPLIARQNLKGVTVECAHCSGGIEVASGDPVTEALVSALLDLPRTPEAVKGLILRRVRPAVKHSSADFSRPKKSFPRNARISRK